jgi:hypothetical protein
MEHAAWMDPHSVFGFRSPKAYRGQTVRSGPSISWVEVGARITIIVQSEHTIWISAIGDLPLLTASIMLGSIILFGILRRRRAKASMKQWTSKTYLKLELVGEVACS